MLGKCVFKGEVFNLLFKDEDDDVWYEVDKYRRGAELGEYALAHYPNITRDHKHLIDEKKYYDFDDISYFKKIRNNKISRKLYKIDDNYTGDLYVWIGN